MNDTPNSSCSLGDLPPIGMDRPDLRNVPREVAARIVDMWRVKSMLSDYAYRIRERDGLRKDLKDAFALAHEISIDDRTTGQKLTKLSSFARTYDEDARSVAVNNWVGVTDADCRRLGCEAAVVYFQMALEKFPGKVADLMKPFPLLYCIRRLRDVVVHSKALDVSKRDCTAQSTQPQRDGSPLKFHFTHAWFLDVKAEDLADSRHRIDPNMARWFQEQCNKHPAWWILQSAIEQLCAYFNGSRVRETHQ